MIRYLFVITIFLISFNISNSQVYFVLPEDVPSLKTDFYISRVIDTRENPKSFIGYIPNQNKAKKEKVFLEKGLIPGIMKYFKHMLPPKPNTDSLVLMIKTFNVGGEFRQDVFYSTADVAFEFFIDNEGSLVKVYSTESYKEAPVSNLSSGIAYNLSEAINECLLDFSESSWRMHPLYNPPTTEDEDQIIPSGYTEQITKVEKKKWEPADILFMRVQFNLEAGYSHWFYDSMEGNTDEANDFIKDLSGGFDGFVDGSYYFMPEFAVGLRYGEMRHNAKRTDWKYYDDNDSLIAVGYYEKDIKMRFAGPVFYSHTFFLNNNLVFNASFSPGWLWYEEDYYVLNGLTNVKGNDFALMAGAGIELVSGYGVTLGFNVSYVRARLNEINFGGIDQELINDYKLDHLNLNVSLKIFR